MIAGVILWGHALAALLFAGVALSLLRERPSGLPRLTMMAALGGTALWGLAVAGIGGAEVVTRLAESGRDLAWLAFMFALVRRGPADARRRAVSLIYGAVMLVVVAGGALAVAQAAIGRDAAADLGAARALFRAVAAIGALVLVQHLHGAVVPRARAGVRLVVIALAAMWGVDLMLAATAYAAGGAPQPLLAARGIVMALTAPILAVAVQRGGDWTLHLSRTVAWQTLSAAATILYAVAMLLAISAIATLGGDHARLLQTAFVFGTTAAGLTMLSSPRVKAWTKIKLAKHVFAHRYDYRAEWMRFTDTLGQPEGATPLAERIVKAVADLTDSPAGLLLVPEGAGLGIGAGWRWAHPPAQGSDEMLAAYLAASGRIIELDAVRGEGNNPAERASVPAWMLASDAWALVPLVHLGKLAGAILLARPPIDRALDWEDFDLLRVAGRQVASYLAEARAQEALAEAERFDEFNRRFAFILHDIKNLVSQLTLTARNAERHAENPAFRADMIATLKDSAGRMNDLLARLSQHHSGRAEEPSVVDLADVAERVIRQRRRQHPITLTCAPHATALADPARLEQLLAHLLQNAIEASGPDQPVEISVAGGARPTLIVADSGCGMSPAFVREQLFKPFVSSKPGGFGIGAFEARQLAEAMGGGVAVTSREGAGTRFVVTLAPAPNMPVEQAA
ncbi:PEP-CTERM system histidine kinase PrsK [Sphingomonas sp. H39-1-10]|uniref:XrtA/PEP-CTERM system histidine kinase PrsK n=1 Tax=Sphingomonas pollutisoli TaxID=3030829 RepID=UPI0023B9913F|nr:XrtA/PEP-CTERM system histidine kinase PrsK [Sphingomonas pollutisoli]MDF0489758.1 PEP-CTERM system histidine kinase PrsK [Sphingomonas pollutisoli]